MSPANNSLLRLTRQQVREIDRRSMDEYHIPGIVLMENAARAVADAAWEMLGSVAGDVMILCGGGNNGGDGLAAARHLHNRGARVAVYHTLDPVKYRGDALTNWQIAQSMNLVAGPASPASIEKHAGLIIDAIFGTGLTEAPRGDFASLVRAIDRNRAAVLAVDLPSGLDCDTGQPLGPACVRAHRTVTFVAEKTGFANPASREYTGIVSIGDIGCPKELIRTIRPSQVSDPVPPVDPVP